MHTGKEWCTLGCTSTTWRCRTFPLPTTQSAACNILSGCNTECKVTINIIILIVIIIITAARVFLMLSLWEQGGGVVKRACNPSQPVESLESQFSATFRQIHSFHHHHWPWSGHSNFVASNFTWKCFSVMQCTALCLMPIHPISNISTC